LFLGHIYWCFSCLMWLFSGKGIHKVKCPYGHWEESIKQTAMNDTQFCPIKQHNYDKLHLHYSHAYYYQIQMQLFFCNMQYCDFYIFIDLWLLWTEKNFGMNTFHNVLTARSLGPLVYTPLSPSEWFEHLTKAHVTPPLLHVHHYGHFW